jgi:ABC-type polysaccharide/polyol phosphate export permease
VLALATSLRKNRRLLLDLVRRDLSARYVASSMGFFWSVIFPLLNLFIYMFVFSFVLNTRWDPGQSDEETALLMLAGILVWQAFAESLSRSTNALVENQNLIQKVVFPSEVLPVYLSVSAIVNMLIGVAIALLGVAWYAWISPVVPEPGAPPPARELGFGITLVSLPVLIAVQLVFTAGLGFFFSALNLFLRDVYHVMGVALSVGMFLTPIFYPARFVQEAGLGWVLQANPMYWLVDSYRRVLIYGLWPQPPIVAAFAIVAGLVFLAGVTFFLRQKPHFPDLL